MASVQRTYQVEGAVTYIAIMVEGRRVVVQGVVRVAGTTGAIASYEEDVTDLMSQADRDRAIALVNSAQAWIDSKR